MQGNHGELVLSLEAFREEVVGSAQIMIAGYNPQRLKGKERAIKRALTQAWRFVSNPFVSNPRDRTRAEQQADDLRELGARLDDGIKAVPGFELGNGPDSLLSPVAGPNDLGTSTIAPHAL